MAQHLRAARIGRDQPADGGRSAPAQCQREAQGPLRGRIVQRLQDDACLAHDLASILVPQAEGIHPPQRQQQRRVARIRGCAAGHAAVAALGHDRHAMPGAERDKRGDLGSIGRRGEGDRLAAIASAPIGQPRLHQLGIAGQAALAQDGLRAFQE